MMLGRLVRCHSEMLFLCSDGTLAEVDESFLMRIFLGFKQPDLFIGSMGRWDMYPSMEAFPGETMAFISEDKELVILDSGAFSCIMSKSYAPDYLTTKEYAMLYGKSIARVKTLCVEGRLPGAIRKGRQWFIPKYAQYPEDRRKYNNQHLSEDFYRNLNEQHFKNR